MTPALVKRGFTCHTFSANSKVPDLPHTRRSHQGKYNLRRHGCPYHKFHFLLLYRRFRPRLRCCATEPDYRQVIKYMERVQKQRGEECKFVCGYEAGCLGYSLYHQLTRCGVDCVMNIYTNFHRFLRKAGISYGGKGKGPRVYDLRHTFAVHCLRHLVLSGKDIGIFAYR